MSANSAIIEPHSGGVIIPIKPSSQTGKWFQYFLHQSFFPLGILETLQIRTVFSLGLAWSYILLTMYFSHGQGDFYQYIWLYLLSDSKMLISIKVRHHAKLQIPANHL